MASSKKKMGQVVPIRSESLATISDRIDAMTIDLLAARDAITSAHSVELYDGRAGSARLVEIVEKHLLDLQENLDVALSRAEFYVGSVRQQTRRK